MASEPATVAEVRHHARLDADTPSDAWIAAAITAARRYIEAQCNRSVQERTFRATFDSWPCGRIIIIPPASSVDSIVYDDVDGDEQTLSASLYFADVASAPARIELIHGAEWPDLREGIGAVRVNFTAGNCPEDMKIALLMLVAEWAENREATIPESVNALPFAVRALLAEHRLPEIA